MYVFKRTHRKKSCTMVSAPKRSPMRPLVVSGSYQNDQNGAVIYQLTDIGVWGGGECIGDESESV
jgi:hypothetical protein